VADQAGQGRVLSLHTATELTKGSGQSSR
jgi:hypothetical protein